MNLPPAVRLNNRREKPRARHRKPSSKRVKDEYVRYFNNSKYEKDDDRIIVSERGKETIQAWYPENYDEDDVFSRPLAYIWLERVTIKGEFPEWFLKVRDYLNTQKKIKVLGGGMKDIVIPGDGYVYTFYIPDRNFQNTYINNLKTFTMKMAELDPQVQKRVNYPKTLEDICVYEFIRHRDVKNLVTTRLKYCANSDLNKYQMNVRNVPLGIKKFAQISYELIKTLRVLHSVDIYLLDIKPRNIFSCFVEGQEVFVYGDVDLAVNCHQIDCTKKNSYVHTPDYTTMMLMTQSKIDSKYIDKKNVLALRDIYALMKTLLVTFIKLNSPSNPDSRDIMVGALKNLMKWDVWYDNVDNETNRAAARIWQADIDRTVEYFNDLIGLLGFGDWRPEELKIFNENSPPTQEQVLESLKALLIGKNGILQLMISASYGDLKRTDKDANLKSIQTLAKKCGAESYKWEKPIENVSDLFKRIRGSRLINEEEELVDNMELMNFEEMGRRRRRGGRRRRNPCWQGYRRNYNKKAFTKGSCVPKIKF